MDYETTALVNRLVRRTEHNCLILRGSQRVVFKLPTDKVENGQDIYYAGECFQMRKVGIGSEDSVLWVGFQGNDKEAVAAIWLAIQGYGEKV